LALQIIYIQILLESTYSLEWLDLLALEPWRKIRLEEYLSVAELSGRIKLAKQTIYNMIHRNTFTLNTHYLKPTPKKILFKWTAIQAWLEGDQPSKSDDKINLEKQVAENMPIQATESSSNRPRSLFNI
jgi:hypothetical protein